MGAGKSKTLKINRKKSGKYLDSISKIERVRQVSGIDIKINPQQVVSISSLTKAKFKVKILINERTE